MMHPPYSCTSKDEVHHLSGGPPSLQGGSLREEMPCAL